MKEINNIKYNIRPANIEDIPKIHALEEKKSLHYHGVPGFSLEILQNAYAEPGFKIENSVHLVEDGEGNLVAEVEVWDQDNPPVHPFVWLALDPNFKGEGLENYLLDWAEKRALEALERVEPELRVSLRSQSIHENKYSINAKLAAGYKLIRHSFRMSIEMEEPPPVPIWPEGISLRMYDPDKDDRDVFKVDDEVFQDHFGYVEEPPEEGFKKFMHHMTGGDRYDPSLWYLAVAGEEIVGICLGSKYGFEDKESGWISSLGVKRAWRRQGIALGLLQVAFGEFYTRGQKKVGLGVDAESLTGATDLYKKAGMSILRQFDMFEKELRPGRNVSVTSLETSE